MNTENDNVQNDEQLSGLYRQTTNEQPPQHIDAAILAAARRETDSRPHPAFSPFSSNWRVPVSVAAVLVLTISIVNLIQDDDALINDVDSMLSTTDELALTDQPDSKDRAVVMQQMEAQRLRKEKNRQRLAETEMLHKREQQQGLVMNKASAPSAAEPLAADDIVKPVKPALRAPVIAEQRSTDTSSSLPEAVAHKKSTPLSADSHVPASTTAEETTLAGVGAVAEAEVVPSVELISSLRKQGKVPEANRAADAFLEYYFDKQAGSSETDRPVLSEQQRQDFITELRALDRAEDADNLQKLLDQR